MRTVHGSPTWLDRLGAGFDSSVVYPLLGWVLHRPTLLRTAARWLPRLPFIGFIGSYRGVTSILLRQASFSNTAHQGDLPEGIDFVIGMDEGKLQQSDRKFLLDVLATPEAFGAAAARESSVRTAQLGRPFDLIDDYLTHVVWAGLRESFSSAAPAIENFGVGSAGRCPFSALYEELRYVGAQLLGGAKAPAEVRFHAQQKAVELNRRVEHCEAAIASAWGPAPLIDPAKNQRNVVGLMWVGHPATVQGGALIMQSLLDEPARYALLRQAATQDDPGFRDVLRGHVIEMLRFRPPFPILNRDVPRDTFVDADGRHAPRKAGSFLEVLMIGAMFDDQAMKRPESYEPDRADNEYTPAENKYLMFGFGKRSCIAKHQVIETLVSAIAGLLRLPELTYASDAKPIEYEGSIIRHMRVR